MALGYEVFKDFENGKYVHFDDLKHMTNHICGNLNNLDAFVSFLLQYILLFF